MRESRRLQGGNEREWPVLCAEGIPPMLVQQPCDAEMGGAIAPRLIPTIRKLLLANNGNETYN